MRARTVLLLTAAAVCSVSATFLTRMNMSSNRDEVRVEQRLIKPPASTMVVAARDLAFGKRLDKSMLRQVSWPAKLLPQGAFAKVSDLVGRHGGRVVMAKIAKGEPILKAKISKPGQRPSLSGALAETKSAVTIRVDDVQGVAGFIQPADLVDVLLTRKSAGTTSRGVPRANGSSVFTDVLLQNVKVLAVDQRYVRSMSAKPARAVTLEVDQVQAQKLVLAASVGKLSLTLKNGSDAKASQPRRISLDDLPSSSAQEAAPAQIVSETINEPADPVVTIVRGVSKREIYRVPGERIQHRNSPIVAAGPDKNRAEPNDTPSVSRGVIEPLTPPPLTGWRTRWSRNVANAVEAREKKSIEGQSPESLQQ